MASLLPVSLSGDTLGQRHRHLSSLVEQAASDQASCNDIEALPEQTALDRLFKIDLANKLKNVHYILKNVKDDDMLYVSRALKSKWLLEHHDVIDPKYLEETLFPNMITPAISKMKNWLYIHLSDPRRCQQFYQYYKETQFDFAVKFLSHCDYEFVLNEFPNIMSKISPHCLKVLAEKYPKLVKIYFDALASDDVLVKRYLQDERKYYKSIRCILKTEPDVFLDITEKYHTLSFGQRLSPSATDYILRFHKSRFMSKVELYCAYLLHIPTVAKLLSVEECQEIVMKLARAQYLGWWFTYKNVEPLVKRVSRDERAAFKKRVFVEKDVGELVSNWPYKEPASPTVVDQESHVFNDQEHEVIQLTPFIFFGKHLKKRKYLGAPCAAYCRMEGACIKIKTELEKLFDEFRFKGFEATLHELSRRVGAASSADRRRDMLLVLVSKSGGHADSVRALLQLALRLRNEPVHERAAVVRSLARRAAAWRLPQDVWDTMLQYARGLGLDGSAPEAECREGLHAVVLRCLIAAREPEPAVRAAFLEDFTTLAEYKLSAAERAAVAAGLQRLLVSAAADAEPELAATRLHQLLDVLKTYRIRMESSPIVSAATALAERNSKVARKLLECLYSARVGRRDLLRYNLEFRHDDAALLNALRHEPAALRPEWIVKLLADAETRADRFLLKVIIYFNGDEELAQHVHQLLEEQVTLEPHRRLARPLATLAGIDMQATWREHDGDKHSKVAAELRANMHRARPAPDALALSFRDTGMKAVAWRAMRCPPALVTELAQSLLKERSKRTVRLALALAHRTDCAVDIFATAASIRPASALRAALLYFRRIGDAADPRVWDIVKPVISRVDLTPRQGLRHILKKVSYVPKSIRADYCASLYLALDKITDSNARDVLSELMKCLPQVSDDLLDAVLVRMLENIDKEVPESYPAIVIRYLILSKSENELKTRMEKIGKPFLEKLDTFRERENEYFYQENIEQIVSSLRYNSAFFDVKHEFCLPAMERVVSWFQECFPKEKYIGLFVKLHATMLYYKAVRQSIKQSPEVFEDIVRKRTEGVDIVGFTFGRYIVKELVELKSQYFDSIVELYRSAFSEYLGRYFSYGLTRAMFTAAIIKGILSESDGSEARLTISIFEHVNYNRYGSKFDNNKLREETKELMLKNENKEMQFFAHAELVS
ncbi:uncharacterized protein LOC142984336 [Anticarsia gemmatalis]|uniref:uncharacterized protein LOC142984336 n=1 Tax=Anticarsia gemmatalis TaxID=129554 RepID=UPI003F765076